MKTDIKLRKTSAVLATLLTAISLISCNVPFYLWTGEPCGQFEITYKLVDNTFVCDTITYTPEIN